MNRPVGTPQQNRTPHPAQAQILAALDAERAALQNFVALLQREQGMLVENQTVELLDLSEQKSSDANRLNKLAEARRVLLQTHISQQTTATPPDGRVPGGLGKNAIDAWLGTHCPGGLAAWKELLALAERARQLNQTNGELIQMKLRHNQQSLTVLSSAVNKANLYGPNGQPSFSSGSGRSLGSG